MLAAGPSAAQADDTGPTVFAAASLKNALDAIASDWQDKTGEQPVISYAATSALAKQIEQGADADIFVSADLAWMDYVADRDLVVRDSRFSLLGNRLVLIAAVDSNLKADIVPGFPLASLLGDGRLAIAGVDAVPAGKYAKAALKSLGLWDQIEDKLAQAENVRAALRLVSRGETQLGIVYASDAKADPRGEGPRRVSGRQPSPDHLSRRQADGLQVARIRGVPGLSPVPASTPPIRGTRLRGDWNFLTNAEEPRRSGIASKSRASVWGNGHLSGISRACSAT